jgi:hypothetical protein
MGFLCTRNPCIAAHAAGCGAELPQPTLAKTDAQMSRKLAGRKKAPQSQSV